MDKEFFNGLTKVNMSVHFIRIVYAEMENLSNIFYKKYKIILNFYLDGLMVISILGSGKMVKNMVGVHKFGVMGGNMRVNIYKISSMVMENLVGLMEQYVKEIGKMGFNMEKVD